MPTETKTLCATCLNNAGCRTHHTSWKYDTCSVCGAQTSTTACPAEHRRSRDIEGATETLEEITTPDRPARPTP